MTSRERVLAVFRGGTPDRIPVWCGASPEFIDKAAKYLGDVAALPAQMASDFADFLINHFM